MSTLKLAPLPYPHTVDELVTAIYEDNYSHLEFIEQMSGGDCDCTICLTMQTILKYWTTEGEGGDE